MKERKVDGSSVSSYSLPKVAVTILNWNGYEDTIVCLEHMVGVKDVDARVIVLDNASYDDSFSRIRQWASKHFAASESLAVVDADRETFGEAIHFDSPFPLTLLQGKANYGFAQGCNLAVRYALRDLRTEFVYLLNNDAFPDAKAIREAVRVAKTEGADIVGSVIKASHDGSISFAGSTLIGEAFYPRGVRERYVRLANEAGRESYEVGMAQGSAMLIRRKALESKLTRDGYVFNPALFMYCEELEFCTLMARRGHKLRMASHSIVYHRSSAQERQVRNTSRLTSYYATRNHLLTSGKLIDSPLLRLTFHLYYPVFRLALMIVKVFQGNSGAATAVLQGLFDGYRQRTGQWPWHEEMRAESSGRPV